MSIPSDDELRTRNPAPSGLLKLGVTVACFAILGSIVITAFAKVRSSQREVTCSSNLRQLGAAFLMYAQDNDGAFPPPGGHTSRSWNDVDSNGRVPMLDPYLAGGQTSVTALWACPNLSSASLAPPAPGDELYALSFPRTYGMNTFLRSPGGTDGKSHVFVMDVDAQNIAARTDAKSHLSGLPGGIRLAAIPYPASVDLLYEGIPTGAPAHTDSAAYNGYVARAGDWRFVGGYWQNPAACAALVGKNGRYPDETCQNPGLNAWHSGRNNYLYCDGHLGSHAPVHEGWYPTRSNPGDFLVSHCRDSSAPCP